MTKKRPALAALAAIAVSGPANAAVTVSNASTQNMTCGGGVCAPTSTDATLNVADLETLLASGNVKVTTTGSGVQGDNIDVKTGLSWSSANSLALDAYQSITIDKRVTIVGLSGLSLTTNDGGAGGMLSFGMNGSVNFSNLSSQLAINGAKYTLVSDIVTLAENIAMNSGGSYALANDYDASKDGTYQASPVSTTFEGAFDGLGNTIANLAISQDVKNGPSVGLFSEMSSSAGVHHLNLSGVNISAHKVSDAAGVGGLVGLTLGGALQEIRVSGKVLARSTRNVGGAVGTNTGTITNSISTATVVGSASSGSVGGLVGYNSGPISDSYATGPIRAHGKIWEG